jgi:hypothetical protein
MAATMKAAFTLTLEDKMSSAMKNIGHGLEDLKKVGSELNLGKLGQNGAELLRTVGQEVRSLTSELRTIEAVADRSWAAMKRMASVSFHNVANAGRSIATVGKQTLGQGGLIGAAEAVGGAAAIFKPARDYATFENINRHSALTQGLSGPAADEETRRLMRVFSREALVTGQSSESISTAYQEFVQAGMKPDEAEALMPTHSRAATAYNMTTAALGPGVFALYDTFKIGEKDMPGALAGMALASKAGRFKVEDFSRFLPGLSSDFAKWGMTGRESANIAFASIETVMRNSADPGTANAAMSSLLNHLAAPATIKAFALESKGMPKEIRELVSQYHLPSINLPRLYADARRKHIDPLTAAMAALEKATHGLPPDVQAIALGAYINEKEERLAAQALLQHPQEYRGLLKDTREAGSGLLLRDFLTALAAPLVKQNTGIEAATQLERRAGEGFEPIVDRLVAAGKSLVGTVELLDKKFPGLGDAVLTVTGGMIALGSALAAIGFIAPAVAGGAAVVGGVGAAVVSVPVTLAAAPFAGLGVAIASGEHPAQYPLADPSAETAFPLPVDLTPPATTPPPAEKQSSNNGSGDVKVTIHNAAPGTSAAVERRNRRIHLDPGQTLMLP